MVQKWFKSQNGKKALAAGYVIALVVISIEALRYVLSTVIYYIYYGASFNKLTESVGYGLGYVIAIVILYWFIRSCNWDENTEK